METFDAVWRVAYDARCRVNNLHRLGMERSVMNRWLIGLIFGAACMMWTTAAFAQQPPPATAAEKPRDDKKDDKDKKPEEKNVTSQHFVRIGGQEIKKTAARGV